jgi:4-hydroxybenzoyl-CoA thioesterase
VPGLSHQRQIPVSWGDCDAAAVVFYPRYYAWFDASTHALLESVALPHRVLRDTYQAIGLPLLGADARFHSPATYGDTLRSLAQVIELGRSTLRVQHRLWVGDRLVCEGSELRIWATPHPDDPRRMKGGAIPDAVRERLLGAADQLPAPTR